MTELIWDGKYDKHGRRVAPVRVALPFQTVETVNESAKERNYALDLFGSGGVGTSPVCRVAPTRLLHRGTIRVSRRERSRDVPARP